MDGLRWFLLAAGVVVIVAVYLYSRREARKSVSEAEELASARVEPRFDEPREAARHENPASIEIPGIDEVSEIPAVEEAEPPPAPADGPQKIVTLRVVARNRGSFRGDELILCLRGIGLRHGKFGIFHRYDGDDESATIFSAASLVEPGSFDLANIKEQEIPGISLFGVFPGPVDGAEAFDLMMAAARAITQSLDAELLDESGSTLSIQRERYLREEIIQFEHALNVGA